MICSKLSILGGATFQLEISQLNIVSFQAPFLTAFLAYKVLDGLFSDI